MAIKMKAWFPKEQEWRDLDSKGGIYQFDPDKDGICLCPSCQEQKAIEENQIPEELFVL